MFFDEVRLFKKDQEDNMRNLNPFKTKSERKVELHNSPKYKKWQASMQISISTKQNSLVKSAVMPTKPL